MMNCKEATTYLSVIEDKPNSKEFSILKKIQLRFHVMICKGCKTFKQDIRTLKIYLSHQSEPSITLEERNVLLKTLQKID